MSTLLTRSTRYLSLFSLFIIWLIIKDPYPKLIYFARGHLQYRNLAAITRKAYCNLLYLQMANMNMALLLGDRVWALCPLFTSLDQLWKAPPACGAAAKTECQQLVYFTPLFIADSLDLVPNGGPLLHHSPASFA